MADEQGSKFKGGFTVGEIESKVKKYGLEIALCVIFLLTAVFALIWGGSILLWSILLSMIFAIIGVLVPKAIHKVSSHSLRFIYKEKVTSIAVAVAACLVAIFLPPIIFGIVGVIAGKSFALDAHMKGSNDMHHH